MALLWAVGPWPIAPITASTPALGPAGAACMHGRTCREEARAEVLAAFTAVDDRGAPRSHPEGVLWH
ncbi:MAG: hypothetical protein ACKOPS_01770, partial [Cyanobium sp.]